MKYVVYIYFICFALCFSQYIDALIVGSTTSPSRQSLTVFPSSDSDNEMRGFAWFEKGFQLADSSTTCTYDSYFPVAGSFAINGGRLYLNRDMFFLAQESIVWGEIFANGHFLELASTLSVFESGDAVGSGAITQVASLTLSALVNSVDWHVADGHLAAGKDQGGGPGADELEGLSFDGTTLASVDVQTITRDLYSVRWHPTADRLASGGFQRGGANEEIRIWSFNTSTEVFTEVSAVDHGTDVNAVGWRPQGDYIAIGSSPGVDIYPVDGSGNLGTIIAANADPTGDASINAIEWDDSGNYFAVGTAASAGTELLIYYFNGTTLTLTVSADLGAAVLGVSWNPTGTFIAIGIDGGSEAIRIYEHHVFDGTLIENTAARVGETGTINELDWSSTGTTLVVGRLGGSGSEIYIYTFDDSAVTLALDSSLDVGVSNISDIRWSHDDVYIAIGLDNNDVRVYLVDAASQITIDSALFDNVHLILDEELDSSITMTLQGDCTIEGRGHRFDIRSGAIVCSGTLELRNMELFGVNLTNFRCISDSDSIVLRDVKIALSNTYNFTVGSLLFKNDISITGTHIFVYESTCGSTIDSDSVLLIDRGITFSYAPANDSQDLLIMIDETSNLFFKESSLFVTSTGLRLTKGELTVEDTLTVNSDATVETEGISFGDGISEENDFHYTFYPDASLILESGHFSLNNVNPLS
jgi:WD40 repeat protein